MRRRFGEFLAIILPLLVIIATWWMISTSGIVSRLILPSPEETLKASIAALSFSKESLWADAVATLFKFALAFSVAVLAGVILGLLMGLIKPLYDSLEWIVDFVRSIPPIALFPIFILLFGIGDLSKVMVASLAAGVIVLVNSVYGVRHASRLRLKMAKTMGASRVRIFSSVVLPEALPHITAGMRTALSFALFVTIVTEMLMGTGSGLGRRMMDELLLYRIPEMYVTILFIGVLGYLLNRAFVLFEGRLLHWVGK